MQPLQSAATGAALNSKENTSLPRSGKLGSSVVMSPIAFPDTQKIEELLAESIDTPNREGGDKLCMLAGSFSPFDELCVKQVFHDSPCVVDPVESKVERSRDFAFHQQGTIKQHNLLKKIHEWGFLSNDPKSRPTAAEVTQELQNISELIA